MGSLVLPDGRGVTMGAMFWQLNDVWTAPTWSSIEYSGKWKMLHYHAADFFSDLLVTSLKDDVGKNLTIYGVSDLMKDVENLTLTVSLRSTLSFGVPLQKTVIVKKLPSQYSMVLTNVSLGELHQHELCYARVVMNKTTSNCFFTFDLVSPRDGFSHNFYFPQPPSAMQIMRSKVIIDNLKLIHRSGLTWFFELTLNVDNPTFFVWLENKVHRVVFSTNGFHMTEPSKIISFKADVPFVHVDQFTVFHLAMTL